MDKRYQVFVSSAFRFQWYGDPMLMAALLDVGCIPVGTEKSPMADPSSWDFTKLLIESSVSYIVTMGRYGGIEDDALFHVRAEYEHAVERGIPTFVFSYDTPEGDPRHARMLDELKELCAGLVVYRWHDATGLAHVMSASIGSVIKRRLQLQRMQTSDVGKRATPLEERTMTWDAFVSHASEDKPFARELAHALQDAGLRVWFDEFALEVGDSLRRSIDKGLRESRYGVVILSPNFFRKEWAQKELDGFTARDDGKEKVIVPVWYNLTIDDVKAYSPILADKVAVTGSVEAVVPKLLRAIRKDGYGGQDWKPAFLTLKGIEFAVLPVRPRDGFAICFGRFPITNLQYRTFVDNHGYQQPSGETFTNGEWKGPFNPWDSEAFSEPEKPVVCVNASDMKMYIESFAWSPDFSFFLPSMELWDFVAAEGRWGVNVRSGLLSADPAKICGSSNAPFRIARDGSRDNTLGVSDMFGNVWEWCSGTIYGKKRPMLEIGYEYYNDTHFEVRGGGFLDNIHLINPGINSSRLECRKYTRHSDLGFRIGALVEVCNLDPGLVELLNSSKNLPEELWIQGLIR